MKLEWKSYGDDGRTAKGDKGTWRIVTDGMWWHLTLEPKSTRGMLPRGRFDDRNQAMGFAQERDDEKD